VNAVLNYLSRHMPLRIVRVKPRPEWVGETHRVAYQELYNNFDIKLGEVVLDVSCGGDPFPYATILADAYPESTPHRAEPLIRDHRPFLMCDVQNLPFPDKSVDFIYCSHTLEHVQNSLQACAEIMRVGKRGYIEMPTFGKDVLFCWARESCHKWYAVAIENTLVFFEYNRRQTVGICSEAWKALIFSSHYHPLQEAFYNNQDIFNTMFMWYDSFRVYVFWLDGRIQTNE